MKRILLITAAAAPMAACGSTTAPEPRQITPAVQQAQPVQKVLYCPIYDENGRFAGYMITSGDKCE